jgi:hypothetical protein
MAASARELNYEQVTTFFPIFKKSFFFRNFIFITSVMKAGALRSRC